MKYQVQITELFDIWTVEL